MGTLHPEIRKTLDTLEQVMADLGLDDIHTNGVESARAFMQGLAPPHEILPPVHEIYDIAIDRPATEIPIRVYRPDSDDNLLVPAIEDASRIATKALRTAFATK